MKRVLTFLLLLTSLSFYVNAGSISISLDIDKEIVDSNLNITVVSTNQGNDVANNLQINTIIEDEIQRGLVKDFLNPGESFESKIEYSLKDNLPGTYPIIFSINYADNNGFPFNLATTNLYTIDYDTESEILIEILPKSISDKVTIPLKLFNKGSADKKIDLKLFSSNQLEIYPSYLNINLPANSSEEVKINIKNKSALKGSSYLLNVIAEYDEKDEHFTNITSSILTIDKDYRPDKGPQNTPKILSIASFTIFGVLNIFYLITNINKKKKCLKFYELIDFKNKKILLLIDVLILIGIFIFLVSYFKPEYMFSKTTSTGGDMASHYYTAQFLKDNLLPKGKIAGWTQGNYAGFAMLQFYFPFPFLLMVLLGNFTGLQIAFKLISVLGIFLLPLFAYISFKLLKLQFPLPIIAAVSTLSFLFHEGHSVFGGNIPSTLSGEFTYSIGMALVVLLIGTLYKGLREDKWLVLNSVIIFLIGVNHVYTLLFCLAASLFFLFFSDNFKKDLKYFFKMYALSFLLLGIWIIPLLTKMKFTSTYNLPWTIHSILEVFPKILFPYIALSIIPILFLVYELIRYKKLNTVSSYFFFSMIVAVIFYYNSERIGVIDIRFLPFIQLYLTLLGTISLSYVINKLKFKCLIPIAVLFLTIFWVGSNSTYIKNWISWNYSGFETKPWWGYYREVNDYLRGDQNDPRVVFEHSESHNNIGSSRAYESLPHFSGRNTLEGVYNQSSFTGPAVFYIQSLVGKHAACPFVDFGCSKLDIPKVTPRLHMFNVREVIAVTYEAKAQYDVSEDYELVLQSGPYNVYNLKNNDGRYISVPNYKPNLIESKYWQQLSYLWFITDSILDIPVVFVEDSSKEINEDRFVGLRIENLQNLERVEINNNCSIEEYVEHDKISFTTDCVGKPHFIKISYFPNWKVTGADKIYKAGAGFMMVFPSQENVVIQYENTFFDNIGAALSIIGLVIIISSFIYPKMNLKKQIDLRLIKFNNGVEHILDIVNNNRAKFIILSIFIFSSTVLIKFTLLHDHKKDFYTKEIALSVGYYPICDRTGRYREECFVKLAEMGDWNLCNIKFYEQPSRDLCFERAAISLGDRNLCGYIQDFIIQRKCLDKVVDK